MVDKRQDIQALRGIAVALVVLDHAGIGPFRAGYLGVDIFFVISGFLITGNITRAIDAGNFSFRAFYFRRARRILPAAYVTIALTALAAVWFVSSVEMQSLRDQIIGAVTYTINFVLWHQTGYFDVGAAYKPLLHMWSLAIEEQFYLLWPLLLWMIPRRLRTGMIVALVIASFVSCLEIARSDPIEAFYLLPTRAWELGLGALAATIADLAVLHSAKLQVLFWPAFAALIAIVIWPTGLPHPGTDALIVCAATVLIILTRHERAMETMASKLLARLGDVSYSLYLVHWPVIVFLTSSYVGVVPTWIRGSVIVLCVLLAWAMYRLIERPFIEFRWNPKVALSSAIAATALIVAMPFAALAYSGSTIDFSYIRRPDYGLGKICDTPSFVASHCETSSRPRIMVWGNSYAMHLVPGILDQLGGQAIVQATFSSCPPVLQIAVHREDVPAVAWAMKCINFNNVVLSYLKGAASVQTVVLSGQFEPLLSPDAELFHQDAAGIRPVAGGVDRVEDGLGRIAAAIKGMGKKLVLVGPPPGEEGAGGTCVERLLTGKVRLGPYANCTMPESEAALRNAGAYEALNEVSAKFSAPLVRPSDVLCLDGTCHSELDGVPIYRDGGHLTYEGSREVMKLLRIQTIL